MSISYEWHDAMLSDVVNNLKGEIEELTFKVKKARENENWGTYKNLILAYKEIIKLYKGIILDVYESDVDEVQHIDNNIKLSLNKDVLSFLKNNEKEDKKDMYIDISRKSKDGCLATIYCDGNLEYIHGKSFSDIANIITGLEVLRDVNIYLDIRGFGKILADELDSKGIIYRKLHINTIKF